MNYIISAVAITGNKGAAGMAESLIQNIIKLDSDARFHLLSYYPENDRKGLSALHQSLDLTNDNQYISIIDGRPIHVVRLFFITIWYLVCTKGELPKVLYPSDNTFSAICSCDCWLDAAGISFVDGREKFLPFNVLTILPGIFLKKRIIKVSQALGPFNGLVNKLVARLILPQLDLICARGGTTYSHLISLDSSLKVELYPDITFSLAISETHRNKISKFVPKEKGKGLIGISISQVVYQKCNKLDIDYIGICARLISNYQKQGYKIIVFPHSIRIHSDETHNNDLPVQKRLLECIDHNEHIIAVQEDRTASELRALIGELDLLIASRFHALISALAVATPVAIIGWSHKYEEVLRQFSLAEYSINVDQLTDDSFAKLVQKTLNNKSLIRQVIYDNLPEIQGRCENFYKII